MILQTQNANVRSVRALYTARLSFITGLLLALSISGCRSTNVTDAQGRVKLQVPAGQLNSNRCPDPKNLSLKDSHGKLIEVKRVEKQANGSCVVVLRSPNE